MRHSHVSPQSLDSSTVPGGAAGAASSSTDTLAAHELDEEVNLKDAIIDKPIVGVEPVVVPEEPAAIEAKPLRSPMPMTLAEKEKHDLTHQPPHPGCSICAGARTPNVGHRASHEHLRTIPLLVGDDCFLRRADESVLATCLVMRLYPYKVFLAAIIPRKRAMIT